MPGFLYGSVWQRLPKETSVGRGPFSQFASAPTARPALAHFTPLCYLPLRIVI